MRTNFKGKWTWGYMVGRDRYSPAGSYFDCIKENGKVGRLLTYNEAVQMQSKLGEPYQIKRVRVAKKSPARSNEDRDLINAD